MKITRNATAHWTGTGKEGKGTLTSASTVLNETQYSFNTRFADGVGTNPEELVAAAHAGCFAMKLAFNIQGAGFAADSLDVRCDITLEDSGITSSKLTLKASVPGLDQAKFDELVEDAEKNCPISKLLNTSISVDATLA
ncbi:OsmC family peroxiredoxin [Fibrisoma montanum]|uniref:OsmC family peroxiredoxin n=1 Tax=Fibrisoma montanum TaxID=2305895 RepID=A0A418M2Q5_9BACT|nr:OsmC family protein [Fibrisoma montanum]RIV19968.1 OsmC family peroxiredoxin [Fibrisoma montanum]